VTVIPVAQIGVELRRFFARRMVRGLVLLVAFIILLSVSIATIKGHRSTGFAGEDPFFAFRDTRINVGKSLASAMQGTGVALLFAGFAIGASFVGAEFNVGSLTTQLLFEPRRWRVHLSKAIGVAIGTGLVAFILLAFLAISMYVGSELHGIVQGVDGTFVVNRLGEALRISAAVGVSATLAYAVTLVAKRSSAGMTVFFLQFPLLSLLNPTKMPWGLISHYAPLRGLLAIVINPTTSDGVQDRAVHTIAGGVVLTAVWIVVLVAASGLQFARAEVR
jgi:ABC-2 type transport system permease protein